MGNNKINEIIDIVSNIPNDNWWLEDQGTYTTELNGKKITLQYGYSGMHYSIIIDGVAIFNNTFINNYNKMWELSKRLEKYFKPIKEIATISNIDSVYEALKGN